MNIGVIGSIYIAQLLQTAQSAPRAGTEAVPFFETEPAGSAFTAAITLARAGNRIFFCGRIGGKHPCPVPHCRKAEAAAVFAENMQTPVSADIYGSVLRTYLENGGADCTCLYTDPHTATGIVTVLKEGKNTRRFVHSGANARINIPDVALFFEYIDSRVKTISALVVLPFGLPSETAEFAEREAADRRIPFFSETGLCRTAESGAPGLPPENIQKITDTIRFAVTAREL